MEMFSITLTVHAAPPRGGRADLLAGEAPSELRRAVLPECTPHANGSMDSAAAAGGVRRGDPPKCWGTQREGEFGALDWRPRRARVRTRRPLALGCLGWNLKEDGEGSILASRPVAVDSLHLGPHTATVFYQHSVAHLNFLNHLTSTQELQQRRGGDQSRCRRSVRALRRARLELLECAPMEHIRVFQAQNVSESE